MPDPTPSPTPGTVPAAPSPGDYKSIPISVPTSTRSNPNDIYGLGALYGQPIYLGEKPEIHYQGYGPQGPVYVKSTDGHPAYGSTQDLMKQIIDLYSKQAGERKKHPDQLTQYEQLQQALYQAGFYGQTSYDSIHVGQWTDQTKGALESALSSYVTVQKSGVPLTFTEFLGQNQQFGTDGPQGSTAAKAPAPIRLTDPLTLRQTAQQAAMAALGHGLTDSQLDTFVSQFQSAETKYQSADTGTVTGSDVSSEAQAFAQTTDPSGFKQRQGENYEDILVNLLMGQNVRPESEPVPSAT